MQYTSIRVSRSTAEQLEKLRSAWRASSLDEVIRRLVREYRRSVLAGYRGVDRGRVSGFREEDRLEARDD